MRNVKPKANSPVIQWIHTNIRGQVKDRAIRDAGESFDKNRDLLRERTKVTSKVN